MVSKLARELKKETKIMKKLAVYAAGMMMALSLAACSPTKIEPTKAQTENQAGEKSGENLSPDG